MRLVVHRSRGTVREETPLPAATARRIARFSAVVVLVTGVASGLTTIAVSSAEGTSCWMVGGVATYSATAPAGGVACAAEPEPVYVPPAPVYTPPPAPVYTPPAPVYTPPPAPVYVPPEPVYVPPEPVYVPPEPVYVPPEPVVEVPAPPVVTFPEPVVEVPAPPIVEVPAPPVNVPTPPVVDVAKPPVDVPALPTGQVPALPSGVVTPPSVDIPTMPSVSLPKPPVAGLPTPPIEVPGQPSSEPVVPPTATTTATPPVAPRVPELPFLNRGNSQTSTTESAVPSVIETMREAAGWTLPSTESSALGAELPVNPLLADSPAVQAAAVQNRLPAVLPDAPWSPAPLGIAGYTPCVSADRPLGTAATLTSPFGVRGREFHRGVDFAAAGGSPILAALGGTVVDAGPAAGFGQWIVIDSMTESGLVSTVYGHMYEDGVFVRKGDTVLPGQHIGAVGSNGESSGSHLHFEVWNGGRLQGGSAVDPLPMIGSDAAKAVGWAGGCSNSALDPAAVPQEFVPWLQKAGSLCAGISAPLLAAQIMQESGFKTAAVSPAGAAGPAQFMPATWASTGVDGDGDGQRNVNNVADAVMSQGRLMCSNLAATSQGTKQGALSGDPVDLALAAYNAGLGAVTNAGGMPSGGQYTTETQPYVSRIRTMERTYTEMLAAGG